jgi:hypothetical protein
MTAKSPYGEENRSALRELIDRSEEVVSVFVEELTGSTSLREEFEKTLERATLARKTVDRNLEAILGALNLPTRRDYKRLVEEIHTLQGSILNLNMKLDRLLAASAAATANSPAGFGAAPRPATSPAQDVEGPATARPKARARRKSKPAGSRKRESSKARATSSKKRGRAKASSATRS